MNNDDICVSEEEPDPGETVVANVMANMKDSIDKIGKYAQVLTEVYEGDVLDIPDKVGLNGGCFPFCANAIAMADHIGSDADHRQAKVTRVYMLVDFNGHHSVNWIGHLMAPNGAWVEHDVLLARIQSTDENVPNLKIAE